MIQECERCRELLAERMARFDRMRKVKGGVPLLRDEIAVHGEMLFPGAFDLLFNPDKWTANSIPNFPVLSHDRKRTCFTFHVVDAPLPFAAACVRITCDRCGLNHLPVVLNAMCAILVAFITSSQSRAQWSFLLAKLWLRQLLAECLSVMVRMGRRW
jgi:hypothetical protein